MGSDVEKRRDDCEQERGVNARDDKGGSVARPASQVPPPSTRTAHGSATRGRIVRTPAETKPYKVVMEHADRGDSAHPVATMAEGESLIRQQMPRPAARDTSRDQPEG